MLSSNDFSHFEIKQINIVINEKIILKARSTRHRFLSAQTCVSITQTTICLRLCKSFCVSTRRTTMRYQRSTERCYFTRSFIKSNFTSTHTVCVVCKGLKINQFLYKKKKVRDLLLINCIYTVLFMSAIYLIEISKFLDVE